MDQVLDGKLRDLLDKVRETVERDGVALLSDYPEWTPELRTYIEQEYGHWRSTRDREGNFALGKAFHAFFSFWHYNHDDPPFHCYATSYGDVLFSKKAYRWIASEGRYEFEPKSTASDPVTGCLSSLVIGFLGPILALLLACSCSSGNTNTLAESWRDQQRLPADVIEVCEQTTISLPGSDLDGRHYDVCYTLDNIGRVVDEISIDTDFNISSKTYIYQGANAKPDSCVIEDINGVKERRAVPRGQQIQQDTDDYSIEWTYDDQGRVTQSRYTDKATGKVTMQLDSEYNDRGEVIKETDTSYGDTTIWTYVYSYATDGDYWITRQQYESYQGGPRELRETTTRTLKRK